MDLTSSLQGALISAGLSPERVAALAPRLFELASSATSEHGALLVDPPRFAWHIAALATSEPASPPEEVLGALHAGDLLLAFACAHGVRGAAARLDAAVGPEIDRVNANQRSLGLANPELRQLVLERLLVAEPPDPPRIASYSGRGPLKAWVRVTATRIAMDLSRKKSPPETSGDGELFDRLPGAHDPEMAYMRTLYRAELKQALEAAFTRLAPRQRTVLRQRFAEQLTADSIATIHGVHRATVFGWIESARKELLDTVRAELRARVRGTDATLDSVMAMVANGLDVSVGRLLGPGSS